MRNRSDNSGTDNSDTRPPLQATRLLDQLRERVRYLHYSLRTEQAYVHCLDAFVRWSGMRHPRELGKDLDFARRLIIVREGKGGKDRVVMLPAFRCISVLIASQHDCVYSPASLWWPQAVAAASVHRR